MAWAPSYVSVPELAAFLRIDDDHDNAELELAVAAASRAVDRATGRQFGLVAAVEARTFPIAWNGHDGLWEADIDDLMTTTSLDVVVEGVSLTSAEYELWPLNAAQRSRPWEVIRLEDATDAVLGAGPSTIEVTALWGWCDPANSDAAAVPLAIKEATLLHAARYHQLRHAPFGVIGSPDLGTEVRLAKVNPEVVRDYWRLSKARGFA